MFYELIIGLCVLVYLLWKYVFSARNENNDQDTKRTAAESESVQIKTKKTSRGAVKLPLTRSVSKTEEKLETSPTCPHVPKGLENELKTHLLKFFETDNKHEKLQSCKVRPRRSSSKNINGSWGIDTVDDTSERLIRNSKNPEEWVNDLKKYFKTDDSKIESELRSLPSEILKKREKINDINIDQYFVDTKNKADETKIRKVNKELVKEKTPNKYLAADDFARVQSDITIEPVVIQLNSISREREIPELSDKNSTVNESTIYNIEDNNADELFGTKANELNLDKYFEERSQPITDLLQDGLVPPSELLQQQREKSPKKIGKRESPPKERFAEFVEKTILSDDKIQSIIQNLSLDITENIPQQEQNIAEKNDKVNSYTISYKALELQTSIDEGAKRIQRLIDRNATIEKGSTSFADTTFEREKSIEPVVQQPEENTSKIDGDVQGTLLLKRIQKQSGFPTGLNFGSVIGELKNKTKNGGLKPVFKKFDSADIVDDAQACFFHNLILFKKNVQVEIRVTGSLVSARTKIVSLI